MSEPCTSEQVESTPEDILEESKNEVEEEVKEKRLDSDTEEQINEERVKRELLKEPEVELKEEDHEVSIVNRTYETNETKVISDEDEEKPAEDSNLMETIEQFDKASLNLVETQEKSYVPDAEIIEQEKLIIETETQENKALFEKVTEELVKEETNLQETETKESSNLPDKYDILKEKVEDVMAQEVESFDHETLKPVKTFEVDPIESMKVQQSLNNDIETFDADVLKPTESVEKLVLPTAEVIEQEKEVIENETQANKEVFQNTVLKTLESFDATELKHVETQEASVEEESFKEGYVQEKTHQQLLSEIETSEDIQLNPVKTQEPMTATELAKTEMVRNEVLENVTNFDSSSLAAVTTHEIDVVETMKAEENLKKDILEFDVSQLNHTEPEEKVTLPTNEEIEQEKEIIKSETQANKQIFEEKVLKTLESFDASELKHVEVSESNVTSEELKENYIQEKTHQQLMSEISMSEEIKLNPVTTVEPMTPTDLAKTELSRDATLDSLATFDKTSLNPTITEEKVILPDVNAISMVSLFDKRNILIEFFINF